jgi:hypothetical protein
MGGALFVFGSRRRRSIKILVYDGQGFVLYQKRLSAEASAGGHRAQSNPSCAGGSSVAGPPVERQPL